MTCPASAADSTASKGLGDFQFSIMGPNLKEFPNITHGSILRIHHVMLEEYLNNLTGRVFSPNCVSVMGNVNNRWCSLYQDTIFACIWMESLLE